jgi:hypothetical protein
MSNMQQIDIAIMSPYQDEDINMQLEAVTLAQGVACYNYPLLKSVQLEINLKPPTRREEPSTWQKTPPLPSPTKAQEREIQTIPIVPRGETQEEMKEWQPHTPKATWRAHKVVQASR